jgi:hypothetical protein
VPTKDAERSIVQLAGAATPENLVSRAGSGID